MTGWTSGAKTAALRELVVADYGPWCWLCRGAIDLTLPSTHKRGLSLDHVVPRSRGGDDSVANLRPAHLSCNCRRGNRAPQSHRHAVEHPMLARIASGFFLQGVRSAPRFAADSLPKPPEKNSE